MPSATSRTTLSRQWELLKMLPGSGPGLTASEIQSQLHAAGHVTSKRTIERDLVELSRLFPLQCNDKGTPFGWYWAPGKSAELPGVTLSEALTLQLLENSLRPLIPASMLATLAPRFSLARSKLDAMSTDNGSARWVDKVASVQPDINRLAPEIDESILARIQQALLTDHQLSCRYYSAHRDQTNELTLNPLGLVQRGQVTYLIATAEPYTDVRQFVLHRFEDANQLAICSVKPQGFRLSDYIESGSMQFGTGEHIMLQAIVSDGIARLLRETPLSRDMQLKSGRDGITLRATVSDSWELRWWILSHGAAIIVQSPAALRKEIIQRIADMSFAYEQ